MSTHREMLSFDVGEFTLRATLDLPARVQDARAAGRDVPPVPAVLFCHGFTGNRNESRRMYARLAEDLARSGIASFRFDHRGCGESTGDFLDFTPGGYLADLDAALAQFLALPWVDHQLLGLIGYSLGGNSAAYLLHKHPDFRAVVMWAGVSRPDAIRTRLSKFPKFDEVSNLGYLDCGGYRVCEEYIETMGTVCTPLQWIQAYEEPILFFHGDADDVVNISQAHDFRAARPAIADRLIVMHGADHAMGDAAQNAELLAQTAEYFRDTLT